MGIGKRGGFADLTSNSFVGLPTTLDASFVEDVSLGFFLAGWEDESGGCGLIPCSNFEGKDAKLDEGGIIALEGA